MSASEVSIAACQIAQANGYLKKKHAKGRLLDAIVALNLAINTDIFTKEDITYMAAKYKKKWRKENENSTSYCNRYSQQFLSVL